MPNFLHTCKATDLDATEVFNTVQYRPEIGNSTNLIVDQVTGQIRVNGSFSEEKRATLTVTAFDNLGEEPSLSATVIVKVSIWCPDWYDPVCYGVCFTGVSDRTRSLGGYYSCRNT